MTKWGTTVLTQNAFICSMQFHLMSAKSRIIKLKFTLFSGGRVGREREREIGKKQLFYEINQFASGTTYNASHV